jgi:hypothetical protein
MLLSEPLDGAGKRLSLRAASTSASRPVALIVSSRR